MPLWVEIVLGVALLLAALRTVARRVGLDLAPGWILECGTCGRRRLLADVGGIRIGSTTDRVTWTAARCRGCGVIRRSRVIHESRLEGGVSASSSK